MSCSRCCKRWNQVQRLVEASSLSFFLLQTAPDNRPVCRSMPVTDSTAPPAEGLCISGPVGGLLALLLLAILAGCTTDDPLFMRLDADRTGVEFANTIPKDDTLMNPLDFFYIYNGGGVAAGDLNGDGRTDLFFTGNTVANRLYLNRGDFQFRDVTDSAGVAVPDVWSTGVTLVDANQDGRMDIYVSVGGPAQKTAGRANRLYVNRGVGPDSIPTFEEKAEAYGIADTGYSTHSAFFDYDRDGDLDLYVLNAASVAKPRSITESQSAPRASASTREPQGTDRLYRNDGSSGAHPGSSPTFTDVSQEAGITHEGYGLGLAICDVNKDGWPDVYVANDRFIPDRLYVNNGEGTFTNQSGQALKHQSFSAMGVDIADFNNDLRSDIIVLDMLFQDPRLQNLTSNSGAQQLGEWQYGRNTVQLHNGIRPNGEMAFSEIGQLAGVEATGWSWAPLLADLDNDGDRDLFVTNGYGELVTHLGFVDQVQQRRFSGSVKETREELLTALDDLPEVKTPNRFFENDGPTEAQGQGELQFTERTENWASPHPGISNGAAFADLDKDGDLDLVTNNINDEATILKNKTSERDSTNALRVRLYGPDGNRASLGAKLTLSNDGTTQYHDHSIYRGYQSTVENVVHFGLGTDATADSLRVVWPDESTQLLTDVKAGQVLDVHYDSASQPSRTPSTMPPESSETGRSDLFQEVVDQSGLSHKHQETEARDFQATPLLPHKYSQNGPGLAVGDVDGNGLDDVFVGADPDRERVLFRQTEPGSFQKQTLPMDRNFDDMGSLFFDADGDGDRDLYVVSGGNVGPAPSDDYQDRLFLNEGDGTFQRASGALPELTASGSVVTAADYDEDGDLDLFVGGRVRAREYPLPPRSYILRNDSDAEDLQFTDVTPDVAPGLSEVGLVTDALWTDFNQDGEVDLIVVGEWMPITFFENEGGEFTNVTEEMGLPETSGWWNSLVAGDFDRDGDMDYVAGNLGLNTRYEASPTEPVQVHAKDFDKDGSIDPVLSYYLQGTRYPAHGYEEMTEQIFALRGRFSSYEEYADATFDDLFTASEMEGAYSAHAVRFETSYLEQQDDGTFEIRALPMPVQTAPVFGMRAGDYNNDGTLDLLMVGNWYAPDPETGRADAFVGAFLRGDATGHFTYSGHLESGFFVDGNAKGLGEVETGNGSSAVVVTQNADSLIAFRHSHRSGYMIPVRSTDRSARITFADGSTRREEFYHGSSYLSQSSRMLRVPSTVRMVTIYRRDGTSRTVDVGMGDSSQRESP